MKLKLDENLPTELVAVLKAAGHDPATVYEEELQGVPDSVILETSGRLVVVTEKSVRIR